MNEHDAERARERIDKAINVLQGAKSDLQHHHLSMTGLHAPYTVDVHTNLGAAYIYTNDAMVILIRAMNTLEGIRNTGDKK